MKNMVSNVLETTGVTAKDGTDLNIFFYRDMSIEFVDLSVPDGPSARLTFEKFRNKISDLQRKTEQFFRIEIGERTVEISMQRILLFYQTLLGNK